mgnify:CR=1 FL=1
MAKSRETALYYDPEGGERAQQVKTVLVCMDVVPSPHGFQYG